MATSRHSQYDDIIKAASEEWNVDPNLLRAIAQHESSWNPTARNVNKNGTDDLGLMQINSSTAPGLGVTDRLDPVQSIFGAAKHLSTSLDKFPGRPDLAIMAYNAGDKAVGDGRIPEVTAKKYLPSVMGHYTAFSGAAPSEGPVTTPQATPAPQAAPGELPRPVVPGPDGTFWQQKPDRSEWQQVPDKNGTPQAAPAGQLPTPTQVQPPAGSVPLPPGATAPVAAKSVASGGMSDEDFLNSVSPKGMAPGTSGASLSDDDFLTHAGVAPAKKIEPLQTLPSDPVTALTGEGVAGAGVDKYGMPLVESPDVGPNPVLDAAKAYERATTKIGSEALRGAREGFGDTPLGLSDKTSNALRSAGVFPDPATGRGGPLRAANETVIGGLAAGADLALRAGSGLFRGAQAGITALGNALPEGPVFTANSQTPFGRYVDKSLTALASPQGAARTIAALPEAFPTGEVNAVPRVPEPANPLASRPQFVSEKMAPAATEGQSTLDRIQQLIRHDDAEIAPAPVAGNPLAAAPDGSAPLALPSPPVIGAPSITGTAGVQPETIPPAGEVPAIRGVVSVGREGDPYFQGADQGSSRSVGAAGAPSELTNMTPREAAASRATGEMQRVLAPAPEGVDTRIYVPGTKPTEAEVSGNPAIAFDQKLNRSQNPEPHLAVERANNEARVEYYEQAAGTPTQVERLREARGEQAERDLKEAFGNKQPTDAQPVVDTIEGILKDPRLGERDLVKKYLSPLVEKLKKADGSLKDDPENLYGIREHVNDLLSKAGKATDPAVGQVERQLLEVKGALDEAIEAGAPGYRQYLKNYSDASKPIDAMEYLQDARPKLTNAQGTMTPAAFDRFMKSTVSERAAGGIKAAGHLTEDQMDILHNLHADLKRFQNINLSNPRGSDTSMLMEGAKKAGELALHGVANVVSPLMGSIGIQMGKNALQRRAVSKMTERVLNPNPLRYPPPSAP